MTLNHQELAKINRHIWPQTFSQKAIIMAVIVLFGLNAIFIKYFTPIPLLFLIIGVTVFFFHALSQYTHRWSKLTPKAFYEKLVTHSLFFRLIFLGLSYLVTFIFDPVSLPFEVGAADSRTYYFMGDLLTDNFFNGKYIEILSSTWRNQADWGFSVYLGLINTFLFKSVLLVKFINILLGSFTVVLISKMTARLYSFEHGRLSGIIAMLMPAMMWFDAKYLKETLMIFITVLISSTAVKSVKKTAISLKSVLTIIGGCAALFYFRTVLAVVVILSLLIYFILNTFSSRHNKIIPIVLFIFFFTGVSYFANTRGQIAEVQTQYYRLDSASETMVGAKLNKIGKLNLKTQLAVPLLMINSFVSPYPSFLNMDERQIGVISHAQNEVVRISIYYFAILGLILLIKYDFGNSSLVLSFTAGYILILALTGTSYSDRYHLPVVPFVIVLISVGFLNSQKKWALFWEKYLILIWGAVIFWHLFKLSIRGL